MKRLFAFVLTFVLTCAASAQEIKPRGFDTPAATTTTTTAPEAPAAAAAEETPATTTTNAAEEEESEPEAPANNETIEQLKASLAQAENRLDQVYTWAKETEGRLKKIEAQPEPQSSLPWYVWIIFLMLFIFDLGLFFGKAGKVRQLEPEQSEPKPEPEHNYDYDRNRRGPGTGTTAIVLALLGIGMISASAHAECKISAISAGSVIVKEQTPAPITITLRGCEKEAKAVVAAASGVSFTDVSSAKGKVTAKVAADATAQTGPAAIKVTFTDNSEMVSTDTIYALILDAQTAVVRKDAAVAKAEAASARREVKMVKTEIAKVSAAIATRPTKDEVTALVAQAVAPYQARVAQLERELGTVRRAQEANEERMALLGRATELLAEGQAALGRKRIGFFRRPFNPAVAASADKVREAVATTVASAD